MWRAEVNQMFTTDGAAEHGSAVFINEQARIVLIWLISHFRSIINGAKLILLYVECGGASPTGPFEAIRHYATGNPP